MERVQAGAQPSSLQQTLVYRFAELDAAPFLAFGVICLGLSLTTPKLIYTCVYHPALMGSGLTMHCVHFSIQ